MAVLRFAADQKASITLAMIAQTLAAIRWGVPAKVLADRIDCLTEFACPGWAR
jgi:thiamine transporter ThiT